MTVCLEAQALAPETLLLARIKGRMKQNLARLPNYTCLETIERTTRDPGKKQFRLFDKLRMEVAFVGGKELYAWPGDDKFDDRDIFAMAPGGAFGVGSFALHAKGVFFGETPTYTYQGKRIEKDRELHVFSYTIPQFRSAFHIRIGEDEAVVGYRGTFSVDAKTLDLVQMEVVVVEVPPPLRLQSSSETMEYRTQSIGSSEFLLPHWSELVMTDSTGRVNRNRITFESCRQYAGESVISFADPAEKAAAPAKAKTPVEIPPYLRINARLESPIAFGTSSVGDMVTAAVQTEVKRDGVAVIPKGAKMKGRITRLEDLGADNFVLGLSFTAAEFEGSRAGMSCAIDLPEEMRWNSGPRERSLVIRLDRNTFQMRSSSGPLKLPRGYVILLHTMKSNSGVGE